MQEQDANLSEFYEVWGRLTMYQRKWLKFLVWIEMQKQDKYFWVFASSLVAALIVFGAMRDPVVLSIGLLVGVILGLIFLSLR